VRRAVAGNTNTPPQTLVTSLNDEDEDVREAVLKNPSFPEEYRLLRNVAQ